MNDDNLKPVTQRSKSEAREISQKGGIASGKARREKKSLENALKLILSLPLSEENLKDIEALGINTQGIDNYTGIAIAMTQQALKGNVKAFTSIRDSIGEKPKDIVGVESESLSGIKVAFVDKSSKERRKDIDPKIVGEYTPPTNAEDRSG